jgi:hypothetical protein
LSWFDQNGFSGDSQFPGKREAVAAALGEGYRDTDRNLLRKLIVADSFEAGNEMTARIRSANRAMSAKLFQGIDPVTDLDGFWRWFGSSAVVDEDGGAGPGALPDADGRTGAG